MSVENWQVVPGTAVVAELDQFSAEMADLGRLAPLMFVVALNDPAADPSLGPVVRCKCHLSGELSEDEKSEAMRSFLQLVMAQAAVMLVELGAEA